MTGVGIFTDVYGDVITLRRVGNTLLTGGFSVIRGDGEHETPKTRKTPPNETPEARKT